MTSAKSRSIVAAKDKQRMEAFDSLLQGLDQLVDQAQASDMPMAARIFFTAKEDLVHWAVTMHFHESAEDRFINSKLYTVRGKHNASHATQRGHAKGAMRLL